MMTPELQYLALTATLTALMWMPYIVNMIMVRGLLDAVGYPDDPKPMAAWATRLKGAHANAAENLVVFAALVLAADAAGANNATTALACQAYFWVRLVHFAVVGAKVPWVRTLAFVAGFACQIAIALQILT